MNFIFVLLCSSMVIQAGRFKLPKIPSLTKKKPQPHTIPSSSPSYQNIPGMSGENIKMKQLQTKPSSSMSDVSLHGKPLSTSSSSNSLNFNGSPSIMKHSESLHKQAAQKLNAELSSNTDNMKNLKLIGKITKNSAIMLAGIGGGITIMKTAVSDDKVIIPSNNNNDSIFSDITTQSTPTTYKPTKVFVDDKRFSKNDT